MMEFENPMTFVRSIKGSAASILWAFLFSRRVMSADELERWTGYSDENITKGLRLLVDTGWITARSARGPWCLADGRQLPLMAESDIIGLTSTTTTTNGRVKSDKLRVVVEAGTNPIISDSSRYERRKAKEVRQAESDRQYALQLEEYGIPFTANMKACKMMGIGEPMASQICEMKHVTPEFIEAHVRSLVSGETKGLAIVRIKSDETPALWVEEITETVESPSLADWREQREARKQGMSVDEWRAQSDDESEEQ